MGNVCSPREEDDRASATVQDPITAFHKYLLNWSQIRGGWVAKEAVGQLFEHRMLTEGIMYECMKESQGNVGNPERRKSNRLRLVDMDVYFFRMKELTKSLHVAPRMQEARPGSG